MQKLDLRNSLNQLIIGLKSQEIVTFLNQTKINKNELLRLVVESKAGFDQALTDKDKARVIAEFEADKIYNTNIYSTILAHISNAPNDSRPVFFSNNQLNDLYSFQKTLISTFRLIDKLLLSNRDIFDDSNSFNPEVAERNGNLILQIVDDDNIDLSNFDIVIQSIKRLIETVYLIYDKIDNEQFDLHPKITLIDSGSDISIGIKIPEKAVNTITDILKQFWDLVVNNKFYRQGQKIKALDNSLEILLKIKKAKDEKIIDAESAEIFKKGIIENTEKIVLKNTMTKKILMEKRNSTNRNLMIEKGKLYQLGQGKKKEDNE